MALEMRMQIIHFQLHLQTKERNGHHNEIAFPGSNRIAYSRNNTGVLGPFPVVRSLGIWSGFTTAPPPPPENSTPASNAGSILLLHWTESVTVQGSELFSMARGMTFVNYNSEMWKCRRNGK
jgi:hypothetical protein